MVMSYRVENYSITDGWVFAELVDHFGALSLHLFAPAEWCTVVEDGFVRLTKGGIPRHEGHGKLHDGWRQRIAAAGR